MNISSACAGLALLMWSAAPLAAAPIQTPPPETHSFKVTAHVTYRCYGGYGKTRGKDSRTGVVCDNNTYQKTLIDKIVPITIRHEPSPDDEQGLVGDFTLEQEFEGRKFSAAITLFKESKSLYRVRLSAKDDEPQSRETAVFTSFSTPPVMNRAELHYTSRGQPEEIEYVLTVGPSGK